MSRNIEGESTGGDIPSGLKAVPGRSWVMPNKILEPETNSTLKITMPG